jgi:glycosyltransferase involved in cell wall biosynthesis
MVECLFAAKPGVSPVHGRLREATSEDGAVMRTVAPLLLHVFTSFTTGGAQVRFTILANRLGKRFRHAVVAMDGRQDARTLLDPQLDIRFPQVGVIKGDTRGNLRRFRAALRDISPDLLVTSNWGSIEWALARVGTGIPHLHMEDGFGPEERARQLPRRVLARRLLLRRATVVVPSRLLWRIATGTWRLPQSRLRLLPNGVDLARFAAAGTRAGGQPVVIGTVAALRPEKNISRLIRAVARLPAAAPARLMIVGDGPERAALQALAVKEGVGKRVVFAGHRTDPAPLYADFDIFALSSDTEQMPLSVLEAMASGLPVVATDVGDVAAMLDAANRPYVVPLEDGTLADALAELVVRPDLRAILGIANRARAHAEFAEADMVAAWGDLFSGLALSR